MRKPLAVAGIAILLVVAGLFGGFATADHIAFDLLSTISPPKPEKPGAVIVAIDEPSFSAFGKPWPWPRDLHAQLIRSLRRAGAGTIAFDVVFADPTEPAADDALAGAADPRVILAADETLAETPQGTMLVRTEPLPPLVRHGAQVGLISVAVDPDGVIRRIPRYRDSLAERIVGRPDSGAGRDRLIQYFGGARTYPYVSYYQALEPEKYLPAGFLTDRDVIVGLVSQASPDVRQADAFETSFTERSGQLTPGVEVQATIVDNLRHELWISPTPKWLTFFLAIAGCLVGYAAAKAESVPRRLSAAGAATFAILLSSWLLLRFGRSWASPVEPATGLIASFALLGLLDFADEQRRRRFVQGAFGQYVAPDVVRAIIDEPDRVKLGGERKMITVLFADIRGFTGIAEQLQQEPETLTDLINDVLTVLSEVVTQRHGTIDKYIGDCLMAFWNAPLEDPGHAVHAVKAAAEMIERVRSSTFSGFQLELGVGLNSGTCIVGNMGSHARFDYTVLGDAVNVASRLQALSKDYDTPLLIGSGTVELTSGQFDYVELGSARVRGKQTEQLIYTLKSLVSQVPSADGSNEDQHG